jgi:hypothetical protein
LSPGTRTTPSRAVAGLTMTDLVNSAGIRASL